MSLADVGISRAGKWVPHGQAGLLGGVAPNTRPFDAARQRFATYTCRLLERIDAQFGELAAPCSIDLMRQLDKQTR